MQKYLTIILPESMFLSIDSIQLRKLRVPIIKVVPSMIASNAISQYGKGTRAATSVPVMKKMAVHFALCMSAFLVLGIAIVYHL